MAHVFVTTILVVALYAILSDWKVNTASESRTIVRGALRAILRVSASVLALT
ncbi:hypothetical protein [Photobacterium sp. OFAV2-7]|uniref:hypothetical protein n=1 Tax=Photobacterium sp. OFAV2-7 TaxID=2917748 RepID=UPI001EF4D5F8|nr:hypothetical protein [Photobacterium sp. OFAV2-7]MCG7584592.1 hypothetical protein [Photobacterium sp. OFAV2-7]